MFTENLILLSDSYKCSHHVQYPKGTTEIYSYFESRGGEFREIVFFGLQYFIKSYLLKPITKEDIEEATEYYSLHFGNESLFNKKGWEYILEKHNGYLPISIKAIPEGTVVPNKNVMMTVVNTDPECFWLTNYLETLLSQVWYPCTIASLSREQKKRIAEGLELTADSLDGLPFKLHDFGCRGVSSMETAGIGGAAHLVNFLGTDTVPALVLLKKYYSSNMAGFSIPASEHSTITSYGKDHELDAMKNMLDQYPTGLVACVSDSFDIYKACEQYWGKDLKEQVLSRNGTLVVRPDSQDPKKIVPEVLNTLGKAFGFTLNSKGYKMLPPQVRVIQGDGIDKDSLPSIIDAIIESGWSIDNVAFGSGGGLLQKVNRDTCKFAFKCSSATVDGKDRDVYKQPIGAEWKGSKKGKMKLVKDSGWTDYGVEDKRLATVEMSDPREDLLIEVYRDGKLLVDQTLDSIRERANL